MTNRELEPWETCPSLFIQRGGWQPGSPVACAIYKLSAEEFQFLVRRVDPQEDYLVHVDEDGFSVNHGNVGSIGIDYDF